MSLRYKIWFAIRQTTVVSTNKRSTVDNIQIEEVVLIWERMKVVAKRIDNKT